MLQPYMYAICLSDWFLSGIPEGANIGLSSVSNVFWIHTYVCDDYIFVLIRMRNIRLICPYPMSVPFTSRHFHAADKLQINEWRVLNHIVKREIRPTLVKMIDNNMKNCNSTYSRGSGAAWICKIKLIMSSICLSNSTIFTNVGTISRFTMWFSLHGANMHILLRKFEAKI